MEVIMSVININLFSMMLRRTIDVTVVLPDKINDDEKLPCIWLYHGGSGDHTEWLYHTSLVDTVNERHFAAVLPEVFESCFVNMNIGDRYESFVAKAPQKVVDEEKAKGEKYKAMLAQIEERIAQMK